MLAICFPISSKTNLRLIFSGWNYRCELKLPQDQGGHQHNSNIFSKVTQPQLCCQYVTIYSATGFGQQTHTKIWPCSIFRDRNTGHNIFGAILNENTHKERICEVWLADRLTPLLCLTPTGAVQVARAIIILT